MRTNYRKYLNGTEWRERSKNFRKRTKDCERCGRVTNLSVHHLHYKSLGRELDGDVEVLCWKCHKEQHKIREKDRIWKDVKETLD